jgi:hypothetical protein
MPKKKPRKRTKVKGHYMKVRQRSTKKGKKGTITSKWKPKKGSDLGFILKMRQIVLEKRKQLFSSQCICVLFCLH